MGLLDGHISDVLNLAGVWVHHADRTRQILESGDPKMCDTFAARRL